MAAKRVFFWSIIVVINIKSGRASTTQHKRYPNSVPTTRDFDLASEFFHPDLNSSRRQSDRSGLAGFPGCGWYSE